MLTFNIQKICSFDTFQIKMQKIGQTRLTSFRAASKTSMNSSTESVHLDKSVASAHMYGRERGTPRGYRGSRFANAPLALSVSCSFALSVSVSVSVSVFSARWLISEIGLHSRVGPSFLALEPSGWLATEQP